MEYLDLTKAEGLCPPAYPNGFLQIDPQSVKAYKKEMKSERPKPKSAFVSLELLTVSVGIIVALYLLLKGMEKAPSLPRIVAVLVLLFLFACVCVCLFTIPKRIDKKQGAGGRLEYPVQTEFVVAVQPFRKYYGYTEPNVVTKCLASSDEKFIRHDVCVFIAADGTLRIAADIRRGFLYLGRDLGCYVFGREEISVLKRGKTEFGIEDAGEKQSCAYLAAGETYFVLADRALKLLQAFEEGGPQKENGENFLAGIDKRQNS